MKISNQTEPLPRRGSRVGSQILFVRLLGSREVTREFGLARGLTEIVTVTDVLVERIVKRIGIPWRRIHLPRRIGNSLAVAGFAEVSWETLARIRKSGGLTSPVLWEPVPLKAIA